LKYPTFYSVTIGLSLKRFYNVCEGKKKIRKKENSRLKSGNRSHLTGSMANINIVKRNVESSGEILHWKKRKIMNYNICPTIYEELWDDDDFYTRTNWDIIMRPYETIIEVADLTSEDQEENVDQNRIEVIDLTRDDIEMIDLSVEEDIRDQLADIWGSVSVAEQIIRHVKSFGLPQEVVEISFDENGLNEERNARCNSTIAEQAVTNIFELEVETASNYVIRDELINGWGVSVDRPINQEILDLEVNDFNENDETISKLLQEYFNFDFSLILTEDNFL
jgi:hypothetical protein